MKNFYSRHRCNDSFRIKVFNIFVFSILVVSLVFTTFFVYYQSRSEKEDLIKQWKLLAGFLAKSSITGVFAEQTSLLEDAVKGIMQQDSVLVVTVYTLNNKVLFNIRKKNLAENIRPRSADTNVNILKSGKDRVFEVIEEADTIEIQTPVILESVTNTEEALYFNNSDLNKTHRVIGYVTILLSKKGLDEKIKYILIRNALIATVFLLIGSILIYIQIRRVARPLIGLTEAVRLFGRGESFNKVRVESSDEIGKLAEAFNTMSDNLEKRDIEKQLLEEQLRNAQKMDAVGTLARGVAHDFNNILSAISGAVYIIEKRAGKNFTLSRYTGQIHTSINKAKNLIEGLITFSRLNSMHPISVDINRLIKTLLPMMKNITGENVDIRTSLSEETLLIMADAFQLEQILMNLCTNARDTMPDGGLLTIETEMVIIDAENSMAHRLSKPGRYARITLSDSGTGMDEETQKKIFIPFFTTKEVGSGTGLGLSIVYGIIEQFKGHIDVHSQKGEGTIFRIYFPLIDKNL